MIKAMNPSVANNQAAKLIKHQQYENAIIHLTNAFEVSKRLLIKACAERMERTASSHIQQDNHDDSSQVIHLPSMPPLVNNSLSSKLYTEPMYILNEPQSYLGIILMVRVILFNLALCYQLLANAPPSRQGNKWCWLSKATHLYQYSLELMSTVPTTTSHRGEYYDFLWMASMNNLGKGLAVQDDDRSQDCFLCLYQKVLSCDGWNESSMHRFFFEQARKSLSLFYTSRTPIQEVEPNSVAPAA